MGLAAKNLEFVLIISYRGRKYIVTKRRRCALIEYSFRFEQKALKNGLLKQSQKALNLL